MLTNSFSLFCFLANLAGPPGFYLEDLSYFTLYPINRNICPEIDPKRDIIFELYTSASKIQPEILLLGDQVSIYNSSIDFTKTTVIYFHGFLEDGSHGSAVTVREAYMQRDDHNFIVANAQRLLAGPWYLTAAGNTRAVGEYTAKMIDFMVELGMDLSKVHLIGHSLGGHSAGITGYYVKSGKVSRITGLDPAKPFFENAPMELRLDSSDAKFVDVIHTSTFGLGAPLGHADFYPNGGSIATQPGCTPKEIYQIKSYSLLEQIFCSHWRSYLFYAESVVKAKSFPASHCNSWKGYLDENCDDVCQCTHMGLALSINTRGKFYLKTNKNEPYSKL